MSYCKSNVSTAMHVVSIFILFSTSLFHLSYANNQPRYVRRPSTGISTTHQYIQVNNFKLRSGNYSGSMLKTTISRNFAPGTIIYTRQGFGLYVYEDKAFVKGARYLGQWHLNKRHGQGMLTSVTPYLNYTGHWKDNKLHGYGVLRNGSVYYKGHWNNGRKHGWALSYLLTQTSLIRALLSVVGMRGMACFRIRICHTMVRFRTANLMDSA